MRRTICVQLILGVCLATGCTQGDSEGTSTGNGLVSLGFSTQHSDALTEGSEQNVAAWSIADSAGESFTFTSAKAEVRDIEFYLAENEGCEELDLVAPLDCHGNKIRVSGPIVVDFFSGESSPSLAQLAIPAGTYRRVDVRFDTKSSNDDGENTPLLDGTFVANGTIDATGQAFKIQIDTNVEARYQNDDGIALPEDAPAWVLLNLDPTAWFSAMPLSTCIAEGEFQEVDGAILLQDSGSNCQEIENALKMAIKDSGGLHGGATGP